LFCSLYFICVAAIMPQAMGSGKAGAGCGSQAIALRSVHFPLSGTVN
jgi:hypothetical protein